MIDVLILATMTIILHYINVLNQHVVYLKLTKYNMLNISIKIKFISSSKSK